MAPREISETLASAGAPLVNGNENVNGGYSLLHPDYHFKYWKTFLLFATMGAGASWVSPILLKPQCDLFSMDCAVFFLFFYTLILRFRTPHDPLKM
jgi:hypothetical protein